MAPQSKKTNTKPSPSKKKTIVKKISAKRRTAKKTTGISNFKKNILIVVSVLVTISLVLFGYFLGQNDDSNVEKEVRKVEVNKVKERKDPHATQKLFDNLSYTKTKEAEVKKSVHVKVVWEVEDKKVVTPLSLKPPKPPKRVEVKEIKPMLEKKPVDQKVPKTKREATVTLASQGKKAKLVIIIDDVSSRRQLKNILSLPIKVTPSIFPPYEGSKSNHTLAQGLKHYMIHLPMQSGKVYDNQYGTLKVTDSKEKMQARVEEVRRLFPTGRYINNHTGSVFTDHYKSMKTLYSMLRKEGFVFVDSRTTASTKVPKIAHGFGDVYVARDIFIDNKHTVPYIHKQLRKAVNIAKKKGYAVAIGHPHSVTMKALSFSQDIFKDVEVVYIDEIYRRKR